MKTILAALDFSTTSVAALDWAEQVAASHDALLIICHALAPPVSPAAAPELVALPPSVYEAEERTARDLLEETAQKRRANGAKVETRMKMGPSAQVIVEIAEEENVDLIVAGTRGLTGLERTFLGSVAARVIRNAPCPVLCVPVTDSGQHRPIHRLLVPTDFSEDANLAVDAALQVLGPVCAEMRLTLLHVWRVPIIFSPWSAFPRDSIERQARENAREHLEETAAQLRAEGYDVDTREVQGEPADEIDRVADEVEADIIAMGTHGRSGLSRVFLGSVAERTLPTAPCPVLTVHSLALDAA